MILVYWFWRLGIYLASLAPRRLSFAAAGWMGSGAYYMMSLRRQVAKENFARVLAKSPNHPQVRRVARQSFQNYARYLRDVMLYPSFSTEELEKRIDFHQLDYVGDALALNKGAIIVSAHFGNMDMTSAVVAKKFGPMTLVAESLKPPQLMDYLTAMRQARDVHLYPYQTAPRKMIQALRRNEIAAFLLDFGVTHHLDITTVPVTFFGSTTAFPAGPAQLSLLTGAPIIVGHTEVGRDGKIHGYATPPIFPGRTGNRQAKLQAIMQEIACRFEDFIRQHPEQWYMFRPMWRKDGTRDWELEIVRSPIPNS